MTPWARLAQPGGTPTASDAVSPLQPGKARCLCAGAGEEPLARRWRGLAPRGGARRAPSWGLAKYGCSWLAPARAAEPGWAGSRRRWPSWQPGQRKAPISLVRGFKGHERASCLTSRDTAQRMAPNYPSVGAPHYVRLTGFSWPWLKTRLRGPEWLSPFVFPGTGCLPWEKAPPKYLALEGEPSTWGPPSSGAKTPSGFWCQSRKKMKPFGHAGKKITDPHSLPPRRFMAIFGCHSASSLGSQRRNCSAARGPLRWEKPAQP